MSIIGFVVSLESKAAARVEMEPNQTAEGVKGRTQDALVLAKAKGEGVLEVLQRKRK